MHCGVCTRWVLSACANGGNEILLKSYMLWENASLRLMLNSLMQAFLWLSLRILFAGHTKEATGESAHFSSSESVCLTFWGSTRNQLEASWTLDLFFLTLLLSELAHGPEKCCSWVLTNTQKVSISLLALHQCYKSWMVSYTEGYLKKNEFNRQFRQLNLRLNVSTGPFFSISNQFI